MTGVTEKIETSGQLLDIWLDYTCLARLRIIHNQEFMRIIGDCRNDPYKEPCFPELDNGDSFWAQILLGFGSEPTFYFRCPDPETFAVMNSLYGDSENVYGVNLTWTHISSSSTW